MLKSFFIIFLFTLNSSTYTGDDRSKPTEGRPPLLERIGACLGMPDITKFEAGVHSHHPKSVASCDDLRNFQAILTPLERCMAHKEADFRGYTKPPLLSLARIGYATGRITSSTGCYALIADRNSPKLQACHTDPEYRLSLIRKSCHNR